MRTTRRRRLALTPLLTAYAQGGIVALERLIALPLFGRRVDAVVRARAAWLNSQFLDHSGDREFLDAARRFYEAVVPAPLFIEAMTRHQWRVRRGVEHLFESTDALPIRMQRCLNEGIFAVPGLGPAFWSAIAQALDPLRLPAWTAAIVRGARRVGLIERRTIWYGDLICACERLRQRDPRLTATHVDHFLTLVGRMRGHELASAEPITDPIPPLIAAERAECPLGQRLKKQDCIVESARAALLSALNFEDAPAAIAALEAIDPHLGPHASVWDPAALLPWIAWIWHDDEPLIEVAACEREAAGASRTLTAAVLHLRSPERYPLWDRAAAAGLARVADVPVDNYHLYAEAIAAFSRAYDLHPAEAPAVLGRLTGTLSA